MNVDEYGLPKDNIAVDEYGLPMSSGGGIRSKWNPLGAAKDVGKLLYDIPAQTMGAVGHFREGGEDPNAVINSADEWIAKADARTEQRAGELTPEQREERVLPFTDFLTRGDIADTSGSTGFTAGSMGASVAAAAPLMLAPDPSLITKAAGAAAAMSAGGTFAYRADKNMFTRSLLSATDAARAAEGLPAMSAEERKEFLAETDALRSDHALWEAGPEAVGNVLAMSGVGAIFKGVAGKAAGKIIKGIVTNLGGELATETVTQTGQQGVESRLGMTDEAPRSQFSLRDQKKSFGEVAPQVTVLTGLTGGAGAVAGGIRRVVKPDQAARDSVQQKTLSNLVKNAQVSVSGGVATVVEAGKPPVTIQVAELAKHLAAGGTMDTLTPEQRFGAATAEKLSFMGRRPAVAGSPETAVGAVEEDVFRGEALRTAQERNRPRGFTAGEGQGIRSLVPGRTVEEIQAEEALYQNQEVSVPGAALRPPPVTNEVTPPPEGTERGGSPPSPVAAPVLAGEVQNESSSTSRTDGTDSVIPESGLSILHGSGNQNLSVDDISIVRRTGQKQGKKNRVYGGLYGSRVEDIAHAEGYASMMGGTATVHDVRIKPGTKVLNKVGDITRLSEKYINELVAQGYGVVVGKDPRGRTEYAVIDKNAIESISRRTKAEQQAPLSNQPVAVSETPVRDTQTSLPLVDDTQTESVESLRQQQADFEKKTSSLDKLNKPAKTAPKVESTGVKVRFEATGAGPQVFEVVRQEPADASDLEGETYYTIVNPKTGETHIVESEDIAPVKGQEEAFGQIKSDSVDKSSGTRYSTSAGLYNSRDFKYRDMGEDTSDEGQKSAAKVRKILLRAMPDAKGVGQITTRQVSGAVKFAVNKIEQVFGRRVVFFSSKTVSSARAVPNGFIDRNDPKTIYINIDSGFAPTTIIGHEIMHAMRKERRPLYDLIYEAAFGNMKLNAFNAYRDKLAASGYHPKEKLTKDYVVEEMLADFLGDEFSNPKFWEQLSKDKPSLFRQVANFVNTFLEQLLEGLKGKLKTFQSDQFFIDVTKMRSVVGDALAQYGGAKAAKAGDVEDVAFSTADGALKLGREKVTTAIFALAKQKGHELYVQYAPQWMSVAPLHTMFQAFGDSVPQLKTYVNQINEVRHTKNELIDRSKNIYDALVPLAKKGVGLDVLHEAIALATFNQMTPWKSMWEQDWMPKEGEKGEKLKAANAQWVREEMDKKTGLTFHKAYTESVGAYEALKSDELKDAYRNGVGFLGDIKKRELNNLQKFIDEVVEAKWDAHGLAEATGKTYYQASKDLAATREALPTELLKEALDATVKLNEDMMNRFTTSSKGLKGAYWPFARVGDWWLTYTDTQGFPVVKHYTSIAARREDRDKLLAEGVQEATIAEGYKDKTPKESMMIPQEFMGQIATVIEQKYMKGVDQNNEAAVALAKDRAQSLIDEANQQWLRWQPETSALKSHIHRKSVRGFDANMTRSFAEYVQHHAGNIAWTEQGRKIEDAMQSLAEDISNKRVARGFSNTDMQQHILNDMRLRTHAMRTANVGAVPSFLGKMGTWWYMTSPSIALVQMSQLVVMTLPKIATKYGWSRASKALGIATKQAFTREFTRDKFFTDPLVNTVYNNIRYTVTDELRKEAEKPENKELAKRIEGKALGDKLYSEAEILRQMRNFTPYQMQLITLRESMARNLLDISAAHEMYDVVRSEDPDSTMNKIFHAALAPMRLSELASRKAAILSTLDLATQDGKNFFETMTSVAEVTNDTLYDYTKEGKGYRLQGGNPRVLLMFQQYRIMTAIRLAQLFLKSLKTFKNEGVAAGFKAEATREFIGIMGMSGVLGGTMGLPAASIVFAVMNALMGDDDEPYDSELEWRKWLAETVGERFGSVMATGIPSFLGVSASKRVGLQDIYGMQQSPPPGMHGRNLAAWWAVSQLGPVGSIGQSWFQGYDEIMNKGNYMKGLEVSTPKPIRDALKAYRLADEGLKTGAGKRLLTEEAIGADEIMLMALGFNPEQVAKAQAAERSLNRLSTIISERRGKLIKRAAIAILEGDTNSDALADVLEFNRKMPRYTIFNEIRPAVKKIITGDIGVTGPRDRDIADQYEIPSYL